MGSLLATEFEREEKGINIFKCIIRSKNDHDGVISG